MQSISFWLKSDAVAGSDVRVATPAGQVGEGGHLLGCCVAWLWGAGMLALGWRLACHLMMMMALHKRQPCTQSLLQLGPALLSVQPPNMKVFLLNDANDKYCNKEIFTGECAPLLWSVLQCCSLWRCREGRLAIRTSAATQQRWVLPASCKSAPLSPPPRPPVLPPAPPAPSVRAASQPRRKLIPAGKVAPVAAAPGGWFQWNVPLADFACDYNGAFPQQLERIDFQNPAVIDSVTDSRALACLADLRLNR